MFGLYMQAKEGDRTTDAPGGHSGQEERGNMDAWTA